MEKRRFAIVCGDTRQLYLANMLSLAGHSVSVFGFDRFPVSLENARQPQALPEALAGSEFVVLPMPAVAADGRVNAPLSDTGLPFAEVALFAPADSVVFGGQLSESAREVFLQRNIRVWDYLEREELAVLNAIPTAEGALGLAMRESDSTVFGARVLICGYGRIGRILGQMLKNLGAAVSVAVRKYSDMAWVRAAGMQPEKVSEISLVVGEYDLIFNTVPSLLFVKPVLQNISPDTLLIDLASQPGGIDFKAADRLGVKYRWALSLPGKVAPKTAAAILQETIQNIIEEEAL